LDALAGYVEVARLNLDADEAAAELDGGYACGARAHEGVEDEVGFREKAEAPLHDLDRFLRGVEALAPVSKYLVVRQRELLWRLGRQSRPCKFTVAIRAHGLALIPP